MPPKSHKRKSLHTEEDEDAARAIFQKHFEAQFAPLPDLEKPARGSAASDEEEDDASEDDGSSEDDEEWGGLSDDEDQAVEVVDHTSKPEDGCASMGKRELKAFMSSRPPTTDSRPKLPTTTPTSQHPEDSRTLLSQDLELHRLISESHLLDPSSKLHSKSFAEGRVRAHAADLRLTSLAPGASSILQQKSMPMAMRKGIASTKKGREDRRRREASENGIVLERKGGSAGPKDNKRRRGGAAVDMPGIGRMKGAELSLSERDIQSMESSGGFRGGFRGGSRGGSRGRGGSSRGKRR